MKLLNRFFPAEYKFLYAGLVFILILAFLNINHGVHVQGSVDSADGKVIVKSRIQGVVKNINHKVGDYVKEGETIFSFDPKEVLSQHNSVRQALFVAYSNIHFLNKKIGITLLSDFNIPNDEMERYEEINKKIYALNDARFEAFKAEIRSAELKKEITQKAYLAYASNKITEEKSRVQKSATEIRGMREDGLLSSVEEAQAIESLVGGFEIIYDKMKHAEIAVDKSRSAYSEFLKKTEVDSLTAIAELKEKFFLLREILFDLNVKAPIAGQVLIMQAIYPGQIIQSNADLFQIVPIESSVKVKAYISPSDINYVKAGQVAEIKIITSSAKSSPMLMGKVEWVASDLSLGVDGVVKGYEVKVILIENADQIKAKYGISISQGMPIELYMPSTSGSILGYLIKPFKRLLDYSMREM